MSTTRGVNTEGIPRPNDAAWTGSIIEEASPPASPPSAAAVQERLDEVRSEAGRREQTTEEGMPPWAVCCSAGRDGLLL
jgi:hypothetical protein